MLDAGGEKVIFFKKLFAQRTEAPPPWSAIQMKERVVSLLTPCTVMRFQPMIVVAL